jgi:hypothetical protein
VRQGGTSYGAAPTLNFTGSETLVSATGGTATVDVRVRMWNYDETASGPPTNADIENFMGSATEFEGEHFLLDPNGAGTLVYLVASDGAAWWHVALTKAT